MSKIAMTTVQLPNLFYWDASGSLLTHFLLDGLDFILKRALFHQISTFFFNLIVCGEFEPKQIPVVCNISYGITGGPHSGGNYLEQAIDDRIELYSNLLSSILFKGPDQPAPQYVNIFNLKFVDVVIPAGNSFLERRYARSEKVSNPELKLDLRVPPARKSPTFVEFWLPAEAKDIRVAVDPPNCPRFSEVISDDFAKELTGNGMDKLVIARLSLDQPTRIVDLQRVLLCIAPTDSSDALQPRPEAEAGIWNISLHAKCLKDEIIEAFIHRSDPNFGFVRRDPPSYFDQQDYVRFVEGPVGWELEDNLSPVKRFGSINGYATGERSTSVGAYRVKSSLQSLYTGAGAKPLSIKTPNRRPDVMGFADWSRLNRGILASGTRSGSSLIQTGTSVATAFVTRYIAETSAGSTVSGKDRAIEAAKVHETQVSMPPIPIEQLGSGRMPSPNIDPIQLLRGGYRD